MQDAAERTDTEMYQLLGDRYIRVQSDLEVQRPLNSVTPAAQELLELKAEQQIHNIEDITRWLLINHDNWVDHGGREGRVAAEVGGATRGGTGAAAAAP